MKKLLAIALCLVMVLSMCVTAGAADEPTTAANAVIVTGSEGEVEWGSIWDPDWYVVNSNVKVDSVKVTGSMNLLLVDGCTLTVNNGITMDNFATLSIYGQFENTGTIEVSGPANKAAIDGQSESLIVNGGTVIAAGDSGQRGIYFDKITINGGTVRATGGANADGIFVLGAYSAINGGTVTATGGDGSDVKGIAGVNNIAIYGGIVTAIGAQAYRWAPEFEANAAPTVKAGDNSSALVVNNPEENDYYKKWVQVVLPSKETPSPVYTISFDKNTGAGNMDVQVIKSGGSYELPENEFTAPSGKKFKGWATSANGAVISDMTYTVSGNVTLYAIWEDIPVTTYTVSFDANGGTGTMTAVSNVSGSYTLPTNGFTAPDNKQFKCWALNSKEGTQKNVGESINVSDNTTLYAIWEDIPDTTYTVSFDANGGTGTMTAVSNVSGSYTLPANDFTAPTGKEFAGWAESSTAAEGKAAGAQVTITKDTTLYAIWKTAGNPGGGNPGGGSRPSTSVIQSPHTFDAGIALYGVMALASACGAVYVTKKHH